MRYLFVCSAGIDRSPMVAWVARQMAKDKGDELETHSLGLAAVLRNSAFKPEFEKYDRVFVMEEWMIRKIRERGYLGEVVLLHVDDIERAEPELERIFRKKLQGLI